MAGKIGPIASDILAGINEAIAYVGGDKTQGRVVRTVDVAAVRAAVGVTQDAFAAMLNVPADTLKKWEQNKRFPSGPARTLLMMFATDPKASARIVQKAIKAPSRPAAGRLYGHAKAQRVAAE